MQKVKLPLTLDAVRAAQKRLSYVGVYLPTQMTRVVDSVVSVDSDAAAELSFYIDNQRLAVISGHADISVTLACQRCNQLYQQQIHVVYCYSPVANEQQVEGLPEGYEPIEVNEFGEVDLLAMVEDEIILALPVVPMHESEHCEVSDANRVFGELPAEAEKPNPFAVLASLKQK